MKELKIVYSKHFPWQGYIAITLLRWCFVREKAKSRFTWVVFNHENIHYALSLISGATQLVEEAYWTSTEYSATNAWHLNLNDGYAINLTKASNTHRVRAVSAFIS